MSASPPRVYVHVGPPKTGTTFLQSVIWHNRKQLAAAGIRLPQNAPDQHFTAAMDLRGLSFHGHVDPRRRHAWSRLAAAVDKDPGATSLISHEIFAGASDTQIARLVADLAPAEVHIIYGARDLARQLPAMWQELVKNQLSRPYAEYLRTAMRLLRKGRTNRGFWRAQHHSATLARWARHVPAAHIHVVTLPQAGGPQTVLWQRFCTAIGIDHEGFDLGVPKSNPSLSAEDTEVLRLVNRALPDNLSWPVYERRIKRHFNTIANSGASTGSKLRVPERYRPAITKHTAGIKKEIAGAGYDVVGSLDDLDPADTSFGSTRAMRGTAMSEAAAALLAEELIHPAHGFRRQARLGQRVRRRARGTVRRWR